MPEDLEDEDYEGEEDEHAWTLAREVSRLVPGYDKGISIRSSRGLEAVDSRRRTELLNLM